MKILHLTGWPIPETLAGTEVFVTSLCRALAARGIRTEIGCLDPGRAGTVAEYEGTPIHRFRGIGMAGAGPAFAEWLDGIRPDLVHVQAFTQGLAMPEVEAIAGNYPVVFTAHVPGVVCRRGTMMRYGKSPCDGQMQPRRCATCYLQDHGLPLWAGFLLNAVPERLRAGLAAGAPSRVATALTLSGANRRYFAAILAMLGRCRRVIAVCQWLYDALRANALPAAKLLVSRQATDVPQSLPPRSPRQPHEPLRVGYIGRYDPVKGVDVLVQAVASLPAACPIQLTLFGSADGHGGPEYLARLRHLAGSDRRITINGPHPRGRIAEFFAAIDLLAVPSTWLETGPIVVYEALAHRVPVLGSRQGGIAELVRDGVDGYLLPAGDVGGWRDKLQVLSAPGARLPFIDSTPPAVRTWDQVAAEMESVYESVLEEVRVERAAAVETRVPLRCETANPR
jgi:glycosyltransferase involved in cell wall biosynthesis